MRDYKAYSPPSDCCIGSAILGASAISGGSSLLGGICGSNAASQASQQQADLERQALAQQMQIYQANTANLSPFIDTGLNFLDLYGKTAGNIATQPPMVWNPTQAQLESTPGYQFTQSQMLGAMRNQLAATGTGATGTTSTTGNLVPGGGANLAGRPGASVGPMTGADYATLNTIGGFASQTYNQQFQNWLSQQGLTLQQQQQMLSAAGAPVQTGLQAAGALAGVSVQSGNQIGTTLGNIGASLASGTIGSANALTGGLSGAANAASGGVLNSALLPTLLAGNAGSAAGDLTGGTNFGGGGDVGTPQFGSTDVTVS